ATVTKWRAARSGSRCSHPISHPSCSKQFIPFTAGAPHSGHVSVGSLLSDMIALPLSIWLAGGVLKPWPVVGFAYTCAAFLLCRRSKGAPHHHRAARPAPAGGAASPGG